MTSLMRWDPIAELESLTRDPFFQRHFSPRSGGTHQNTEFWYPTMDLIELKDAMVARLELPGIDPKKVEINLVGEHLTVRGKRNLDAPSDDATYLRRELSEGEFERSVRLPYRVNGDKVKAKYENGILAIHMPKASEFVGRQIPVDVR